MEGHICAPFGGISIDFAFMDKVIQLNKDDMDVVVQPGVCWTDMNRELAEMGTGLFFPIDPGECLTFRIRRRLKRPTLSCSSQCENRRNDRHQLLRNQRRSLRNDEGLGHQFNYCASRWLRHQNAATSS